MRQTSLQTEKVKLRLISTEAGSYTDIIGPLSMRTTLEAQVCATCLYFRCYFVAVVNELRFFYPDRLALSNCKQKSKTTTILK